ncbi:HNH endonuclease [Vibrio rotiferianus]
MPYLLHPLWRLSLQFDEDGITMQEVPKDIHKEFTHRGGVSKIKNSKYP